MSEPTTDSDYVPPQERYTKDSFTAEEYHQRILEEEKKWATLGINLGQMQVTGHDMFMVKCKLQALINALLEGDTTQANLDAHLQCIVLSDMEGIREAIGPQIQQAQLQALKQGIIPQSFLRPNPSGDIR